MNINSEQLNAFYAVAKALSFSKASLVLGLSQPALSIRIKNLEETIGTSLFTRQTSGISLTEAGQKLFLHAQLHLSLEQEVLRDLKSLNSTKTFSGLVRVAGFSTITNSVLIPSLNILVHKYPEVQFEVLTREMHELRNCLKRSEADFVFLEGATEAANVESVLVGYEENVVVEAKNIKPEKTEIYIDNDVEDLATINFFKEQKNAPKKYSRWYLDTATTLLEAVQLGWGRAIHPRHIIDNYSNLKIVPHFSTVKAPIYLHFYQQPFYTKLHMMVRDHLIKEFTQRLNLHLIHPSKNVKK